MTTADRRRPGLSLTEVLVALFIMGLGTIAILTLFPLGALNMASALKDERTSQAAGQADSYMRFYWQSDVVGPAADTNPLTNPDPFTGAFVNPNAPLGQTQPHPALTTDPQVSAPTGAEPSYPVFVDPIRFAARDDVQRYWAGFDAPSYQYKRLPRRSLSPVSDPATQARTRMPDLLALRTCSLLDGLTFDPAQAGTATNPATGTVEREYRYNWLWVLQRPVWSDPNTATMTVVVFDKRTFQFVPDNAEFAYKDSVVFTPGSTAVQVPVVAGVGLAKGGWVMDGTVLPADLTASPPRPTAIRHAKFYRIAAVTENTPGTFDVELDRPIRRVDGRSDPVTDQYTGTLVVLAGVSEVFERPNLTP